MTLGEIWYAEKDPPYLWEHEGIRKLIGIIKVHCSIAISVYPWNNKQLVWSTTSKCIKRKANLQEILLYKEGQCL